MKEDISQKEVEGREYQSKTIVRTRSTINRNVTAFQTQPTQNEEELMIIHVQGLGEMHLNRAWV